MNLCPRHPAQERIEKGYSVIDRGLSRGDNEAKMFGRRRL